MYALQPHVLSGGADRGVELNEGRYRVTSEAIERSFRGAIAGALSEKQLADLDRILARLAAAKKVCALVSGSLKSRSRLVEKGKRVYWWDVAIAVEEWGKLARS
jgi:hypothetical protein